MLIAVLQVLSLLEDAKAGRALHGPNNSGHASPLSPSSVSALFPAAATTVSCKP